MKVAEFQTFSDFLFCLRQRKICNFRHICRATEPHLIHRYSSICLMVIDLGEEGVAGGDGLEVPGVGVGRVVFGQAVRAPVAAA